MSIRWDHVSELQPSTDILSFPRCIRVWRATLEWYWQEINEEIWIGTCPFATLPITNPTWTDLGANPGFLGERPKTSVLSHGTAFISECVHLLFARLKKQYFETELWIDRDSIPSLLEVRPSSLLPHLLTGLLVFGCTNRYRFKLNVISFYSARNVCEGLRTLNRRSWLMSHCKWKPPSASRCVCVNVRHWRNVTNGVSRLSQTWHTYLHPQQYPTPSALQSCLPLFLSLSLSILSLTHRITWYIYYTFYMYKITCYATNIIMFLVRLNIIIIISIYKYFIEIYRNNTITSNCFL
jgi:hypothetical protein